MSADGRIDNEFATEERINSVTSNFTFLLTDTRTVIKKDNREDQILI